ncbi:MAG: ABC transporter ATP-binding protein [Rhodothermales bacterium]|nr:ABC transporter ATP-binding protein [Rhodothermales bacterium]
MIDLVAIEKSYGRLSVLKGLSVRLERGRVTAVVGHNGSGKTTLIKILLGLVRPDAGHVVFGGERLRGGFRYRERVGYMPQAADFPGNLTGREILALVEDLRGNPAGVDESLVAAFGLEAELDKPLRTLSGGTRQKVSAALAFRFRPDVLVLDEPTAGLDPVASGTLKDAIRAAREAGAAVLLTSHVMSEIDELADDLVFLLDGQVRFRGRVADLKRETGEAHLERAVARMMTGPAPLDLENAA